MDKTQIVFVCTGNLCRSPMAQGILGAFARAAGCHEELVVDSAGTHARTGQPPEKFAAQAASGYGADIAELRSRPLEAADFIRFDRLIAMDLDNLDFVKLMAPPSAVDKITLLLSYAPELRLLEIPDPYGCSLDYFEFVAGLIAAGSEGLLEDLMRKASRGRPVTVRGR